MVLIDIYSDNITETEEIVKEKLKQSNWTKEEINKVFDLFFNFEINMVDDGELSDSWFFHF